MLNACTTRMNRLGYESLGMTYQLDDYKGPSAEVVAHLQAIIHEAFARTDKSAAAKK